MLAYFTNSTYYANINVMAFSIFMYTFNFFNASNSTRVRFYFSILCMFFLCNLFRCRFFCNFFRCCLFYNFFSRLFRCCFLCCLFLGAAPTFLPYTCANASFKETPVFFLYAIALIKFAFCCFLCCGHLFFHFLKVAKIQRQQFPV